MSKYLNHIQSGIKAAGEANVRLVGSTILVEVIKRERKTSSGIILTEQRSGKELFECIVVATGAGYYDDDTGEDVPLDTKVGDIVYIDPVHLRMLYDFPVANYHPHDIGLIEESQILFRFRGEGAVTAFRKGAGLSE
jgi:co-chaperonin GroES (HSP10)